MFSIHRAAEVWCWFTASCIQIDTEPPCVHPSNDDAASKQNDVFVCTLYKVCEFILQKQQEETALSSGGFRSRGCVGCGAVRGATETNDRGLLKDARVYKRQKEKSRFSFIRL